MKVAFFESLCCEIVSTTNPSLPLCWLRRWGRIIKTTKLLKRSFSLLFCQNSHQSLQRAFSSPSSSKLLPPLSQIHKMQILHPAYPCNKLTKLRLFYPLCQELYMYRIKLKHFFFDQDLTDGNERYCHSTQTGSRKSECSGFPSVDRMRPLNVSG